MSAMERRCTQGTDFCETTLWHRVGSGEQLSKSARDPNVTNTVFFCIFKIEEALFSQSGNGEKKLKIILPFPL